MNNFGALDEMQNIRNPTVMMILQLLHSTVSKMEKPAVSMILILHEMDFLI